MLHSLKIMSIANDRAIGNLQTRCTVRIKLNAPELISEMEQVTIEWKKKQAEIEKKFEAEWTETT